MTAVSWYPNRQGRQNRGGGAISASPQNLAGQLTLFQPWGQIMPTTLLLDPRIFKSSYGPDR